MCNGDGVWNEVNKVVPAGQDRDVRVTNDYVVNKGNMNKENKPN